jgi:hypothetical protein
LPSAAKADPPNGVATGIRSGMAAALAVRNLEPEPAPLPRGAGFSQRKWRRKKASVCVQA